MLLYWGKIIWKTKRTYCEKDGSEMKRGGTIQKQWLYLKGLFNPKGWTLMGKQARHLPLFSIFSFLQSPQEIHDMESKLTQTMISTMETICTQIMTLGLTLGILSLLQTSPRADMPPHLKLIFLSESKPPGHFKLFHNLDF